MNPKQIARLIQDMTGRRINPLAIARTVRNLGLGERKGRAVTLSLAEIDQILDYYGIELAAPQNAA